MSYFSCVWRYLNASLLGSALYNREEKKKEEKKKSCFKGQISQQL